VESGIAGLPAPEAQPAARRRSLTVVGWAVLAAVLLSVALGAAGFAMGKRSADRTLRAKQGECLTGASDTDLRPVACTDAAAQWRVLGVVENKTQKEAKEQACQAWPQAEASYWESRNGKNGFVLCLAAAPAK
jgi:hypothetical protein